MNTKIITTSIMIIMIAIFISSAYSIGNEKGYRQGQIDAYHGIMRYELKTGVETWVLKGSKEEGK